MNFSPVKTLEELDALNFEEMLDGYMSAVRGDPEPGPNRGKSYWHGWCNRMRDIGELPITAEQIMLIRALRARENMKSEIP